MRSDLPSGTVTFLFTDIEGSTRLLAELGDAYADALEEHRRVLREAFAGHGGVEVDTQGDAFFVAFADPGGALEAAAEAQAGLDLPVRMGIHRGDAELAGEGYVGLEVHRAARICAVAHGGQVVVSSQAADGVHHGAQLRDLGLHRLKDLGEPVRLYQLGDTDFPPLRSLNATNLPAQPNALIGRDREVVDLKELVLSERVVTLTGPGGSGKTRLGLQAAAESVENFRDGVFWVALAAVTDSEIVPSTIGKTIGAHDGLADHVAEKTMLLLLDNVEQLLPGAARPVAELVAACPNVRLLVTSRAPLRIAGEREYTVDPLPEADAVSLFRQRAFVYEPEKAVHAICQRLDGLPLAIELAAARTRMLSPDHLLARLERALPVLTAGRRDAPARQQTLRATIEWSYELLSPEERTTFARLAVFAGFEPEAAEDVCEADLEILEALLEQSLLRRWASGRLGMLETIRELALEKLEASGEGESIRRRHAEHYLELAESANLSLESLERGPQRHDIVIPEQHNFRAALDWATSADVELGIRLAVALENFWITRDPAEGARRLEALLEQADGLDPVLRAQALRDFGGNLQFCGDEERARTAYEQALELFRHAGDERRVAEIMFRLGVVAAGLGDFKRAKELWEESGARWRRQGYLVGEAQALGNLGWWEFEHGDRERARELVESSLEIARRIGWTWWEAGQLGELAQRSLEAGDVDEGERRAREYLALAHQIEDRTNTMFGLGMLAWAAAERGDTQRAIVLWAAIEAEEKNATEARWAQSRDEYAARIPDGPRPARPLELDEAVAYALGSVDPKDES